MLSVLRISGQRATIKWEPITPDKAKGALVLFQIATQPSREEKCLPFHSNINHTTLHNYSLSEDNIMLINHTKKQSAVNITGLVPTEEYCVAMQVINGAGESGFSESLKLSCTNNNS